MEAYTFTASDGQAIQCYRWLPPRDPVGVIHIAHGMGEHAARYDWTAQKLVEAGWVVFANDHRGHGLTAKTLGQFGDDGWNRAITDLRELITAHREAWPGKPMVLFGHSMGAMLSQQFIATHGELLSAVILSGSPGFTGGFQSWLMRLIVRFERWRHGPDANSDLLQRLIFGSANADFEDSVDEPTGYEWLSRDAAEVRKYVEDPLCGFVPCTGSLFEIFTGAHWTQSRAATGQIPETLPIYLFSGTADPVHGSMKNLERLLERYRQRGLTPETRFYEEGRHEMLNETNRQAVINDVTDWLKSRYPDPMRD